MARIKLAHQQPTSTPRNVSVGSTWNMSTEREFIENLLSQRFNFFLVFFSLVIAGSVNAKSQLFFQLILLLGAMICTLLTLVLNRSQEKLDIILSRHIYLDPTHPAHTINNEATPGESRRRIIGVWIPLLCSSVLILATILAFCGGLQYQ